MPLTDYRREILALLAQGRSPDSYLAGGAALPHRERFDIPESAAPLADQGMVPHWGRPGGILPRPTEGPSDAL